MAPIRKLLVAQELTGENSQEKIVHRRKWLIGDNQCVKELLMNIHE